MLNGGVVINTCSKSHSNVDGIASKPLHSHWPMVKAIFGQASEASSTPITIPEFQGAEPPRSSHIIKVVIDLCTFSRATAPSLPYFDHWCSP